MAKLIRTVVDAQGDVKVDFTGFVNNECAIEAERLRRSMSELGLQCFSERKCSKVNRSEIPLLFESHTRHRA